MIFTILLTAFTLGFLYFVFLKPIWEAKFAAKRRVRRLSAKGKVVIRDLDDTERFYHQ